MMTAVGRRRLGSLLAVLVAALALVLGGATAASAHATLEGTDPAQGSVVPTAPAAVTLTFSEGVSLAADSVRVLDPKGNAVDDGRPEHVDGKAATARVALRQGLENGTYTVAWRAVSEDSHPIGGAFVFSIGAPSDTTVNASAVQGAKADGAVAFAYGTARTVAYGAFALLAGAAAFVIVVWPGGAAVRGVQRLLMTGWVALLLSTVAVLMLRGPYERGTGLGQALDLSLVRATLDERIGTALAARLLLLAAAGVFLSLLVGQLGLQQKPTAATDADTDGELDEEEAELRRLERAAAERPQRDTRLGLGLAGLALAIALSATWVGADHSSVGIQVPLALPLAALHLLAMAGWLGGLAVLVAGLRHGLPAAAVDRFSRLAFWLVAVLAATGVYQSWRGLGSWGALVDTEYGRLLLIKIGCVAAMLGVAWISRAWTARLRTADEPAAVAVPAGAVTVPATTGNAPAEETEAEETGAGETGPGTPTRSGPRSSPASGRCGPGRTSGAPSRARRPGPGCGAACWSRRRSPRWCWSSPRCSPTPRPGGSRRRSPRSPARAARPRRRGLPGAGPDAGAEAAVRHRRAHAQRQGHRRRHRQPGRHRAERGHPQADRRGRAAGRGARGAVGLHPAGPGPGAAADHPGGAGHRVVERHRAVAAGGRVGGVGDRQVLRHRPGDGHPAVEGRPVTGIPAVSRRAVLGGAGPAWWWGRPAARGAGGRPRGSGRSCWARAGWRSTGPGRPGSWSPRRLASSGRRSTCSPGRGGTGPPACCGTGRRPRPGWPPASRPGTAAAVSRWMPGPAR
ncbi:ABC transporter [Kitasatospora cheerisanensis KCTC 2395]|uniref:Protein YobA n=1 Tax=Kitasatospora cheerisanensis KCTC 2395 TaxID=1348663 RepID=A0A066YSV1_9ACTN|nr:ABC transporter [Kitasatospora cheerisanensis KCTC 2395]